MTEKMSSTRAGRRMNIVIVGGTRPEIIKMAPIVLAARARADLDVHLCVTGQHRQMLDETLRVFGLTADSDLNIMRPQQTLEDITVGTVQGIRDVLSRVPCDWLLVQGDTTSAFAAALASFYARVRVAHIEAGLRTHDKTQPWPEEVNRRLVSVIADRHYAPTIAARDNLLREAIPAEQVLVTGNTVIDALLSVSERLDQDRPLRTGLEERFNWLKRDTRMILVTGHRRESFGKGFENICRALKKLSERSDIQIVYPVHLNPNVRAPVAEFLTGLSNVQLIEPVDYVALVYLMKRCYFVLTDSGGIQEEAPSLHKPVLVMRATSERMEAVDAGLAKLVGTDCDQIVGEAQRLLDDRTAFASMSVGGNPYGDGRAAQRILEDLVNGP